MVSKMAADQLFMAPLGTACFFAWTKVTEGKADEAVPFIKVHFVSKGLYESAPKWITVVA